MDKVYSRKYEFIEPPITVLKSSARDLTYKQLETDRRIIKTVATDLLSLIPQAIGIHSADFFFIVLPKFHNKNMTNNGRK